MARVAVRSCSLPRDAREGLELSMAHSYTHAFCAACERATRVFVGVDPRRSKCGGASLSTLRWPLQRLFDVHSRKTDSICEKLVNMNRTGRSVDRCSGGDRCGALCGHRNRSALRREGPLRSTANCRRRLPATCFGPRWEGGSE